MPQHGVLFATIVYMIGGVIGTFHHLYFAGTPTAIIALGASFSALEVVPLVFMGFEAYHNLQLSKSTRMGKIIQMADLFYYFSKFLEPCWCRIIWLPY